MIRMFSRSRLAFAAAALVVLLSPARQAVAGDDLAGVVNEVRVAPDGKLWFSIVPNAGTPNPASYCKGDWAGMGMFIPAGDPQYAFYYGLLLTSMTKSVVIDVPNISVFNGTTSCDVSKTGYGLALLH